MIVLEHSDLSKGQELEPSVSRLKHRLQINDNIFLQLLLELQLTQEEIKGAGPDYNSSAPVPPPSSCFVSSLYPDILKFELSFLFIF